MSKEPPHSAKAEREVLAAALIETAHFDELEGSLRSDDFYVDSHQAIWEAMRDVRKRGMGLDMVTVRERLVATSQLARAGGDEYLLALTTGSTYGVGFADHAKIVRDHARVRRIVAMCWQQHATGMGPIDDVDAYVGETEAKLIAALSDSSDAGGLEHIRDGLTECFTNLEELAKIGSPITGLPTGLRALDTMTTGMHDGEFTVIAARPAMGKSALLGCAATHAARRNVPVAVFSLEMPRRQWIARALAAEASIDGQQFRSAQFQRGDWAKLASAVDELGKLPLFIDDTPAIRLTQIRSRCRKLKAKAGRIGLVGIDYLQLMKGGQSRYPSREAEVTEISQGLKVLAKELGCPVVALAQLNRECEKRPDKRPQLSDLRESGAIEQDADVVLFVYREGYYAIQAAKEAIAKGKKVEIPVDDGTAEIIIGKQRQGPVGPAKVRFLASQTTFVDMERDHPDYDTPTRNRYDDAPGYDRGDFQD
jgi:replicative DNA helicase